ncbi:hypothetical protein CHARACLAT_009805 [Characodon lateralis]|uniref:Uncharacterized protein n=1 Tax=Characodon lateralis TaxID=208331 RepID=A0ABU7E9S6_9TELE|nr:hypothetical protein [Characodon lateralis]
MLKSVDRFILDFQWNVKPCHDRLCSVKISNFISDLESLANLLQTLPHFATSHPKTSVDQIRDKVVVEFKDVFSQALDTTINHTVQKSVLHERVAGRKPLLKEKL